ncbi:PrsW family intramembrane metalloprotease, partial [Actinocatenispora comari]|uniref:PrsW family intramembrane metalloprotease n=1 Tax=Actinocatenispora comari TaxID=2807577 RepID=UPI001A913F1B
MTAPALRSPRELLWQPRNWTYWVYLAAVVVAFFSMLSAFQPLRVLAPAAAITAVGVNIALGVVIGLIIVWLSVIHRPPTTLAVAAVGWGGIVAVAIAFYVNGSLLGALPSLIGDSTTANWGAAIAGPSNEEWLKAVGVLAVIGLGIRSVSRPIHGLFLGAWCGLGFQVVEDISYAINGALTNPTSDAAGLAEILGVRGIIGLLPSHWVFAACSGYGIGYALLRRDRPLVLRVLFALGMFALAWTMHFLWNSPLITGQLNPLVGMLAKVVLILAAFFVVYRLAMRAEWRWYRHVLDTDPALTRTPAAGIEAAGTAARPITGTEPSAVPNSVRAVGPVPTATPDDGAQPTLAPAGTPGATPAGSDGTPGGSGRAPGGSGVAPGGSDGAPGVAPGGSG